MTFYRAVVGEFENRTERQFFSRTKETAMAFAKLWANNLAPSECWECCYDERCEDCAGTGFCRRLISQENRKRLQFGISIVTVDIDVSTALVVRERNDIKNSVIKALWQSADVVLFQDIQDGSERDDVVATKKFDVVSTEVKSLDSGSTLVLRDKVNGYGFEGILVDKVQDGDFVVPEGLKVVPAFDNLAELRKYLNK